MTTLKVLTILLLVSSNYFVGEVEAQKKPEVAFLARFLFNIGRGFLNEPSIGGNDVFVAQQPDYDFEEDLTTTTVAAETETTKGTETTKVGETTVKANETTKAETTTVAAQNTTTAATTTAATTVAAKP